MYNPYLYNLLNEKRLIWQDRGDTDKKKPKGQPEAADIEQDVASQAQTRAGAIAAEQANEIASEGKEGKEAQDEKKESIFTKALDFGKEMAKDVSKTVEGGLETYRENYDAINAYAGLHKLSNEVESWGDMLGKIIEMIIKAFQEIMDGFSDVTEVVDSETEKKDSKKEKYSPDTNGATEAERQEAFRNAKTAHISPASKAQPRNYHPIGRLANSGCFGVKKRNGTFYPELCYSQLTSIAKKAGGEICIVSLEHKADIAKVVKEVNQQPGINIIHCPYGHISTGKNFSSNNNNLVSWVADKISTGMHVLCHCMNGAHRGPGCLCMAKSKAEGHTKSMGQQMRATRCYAKSYRKHYAFFIQMYEYFERNGCFIEPDLKAMYENAKIELPKKRARQKAEKEAKKRKRR